MKKFTLFLRKGITSTLALAAVMIMLGGGSIQADTDIFNGAVVTGWEYKNSFGSTASLSNSLLYDGGAYGTPKTYTSVNNITISAGQTIEISAKRSSSNASSLPSIKVKYSSDNGTSWTIAEEVTETTISSNTEYSTAIIDNKNIIGSHKIQFELKNVYIERITLTDALTFPSLSVTVPDGGMFGYVMENTTKTFTVENKGAGTMDVSIASDSEDFVVSPSSLTDITNDGEGKTFDVTYIPSDQKAHSAQITVTPTYEGGMPQVIEVTAGPEVVFDENKATTWTTGSGKTVYVNYTAVDGWNTISFPIAPNSYKTQLFGPSATVRAYAISSFDEGTLTFEKASYMSASTPYLVYVENAASTDFVVENVYVGYTAASKTTQNGVTFQGTFAPKAAGSLTGNYGVTSDGHIAKAGSGAWMKGYRAYFTGVPAGAEIKGFVIEGSDDPTHIGLIQMSEGTDKPVYNMSGQRVQKAQRGIYVIAGKKVVIK